MRQRRNTQRGLSLPSILFWLVFAGFLVTVAVKLGPVYVSDWTVRSIMDELARSPDAPEGGKKGIREQLGRRLDINDVSSVSAGNFTIEEGPGGGYDLGIDYEVRVHLFFNIDVVLSFQHGVLVTGR